MFVRALERMLKCAWGGLGSGEGRCVFMRVLERMLSVLGADWGRVRCVCARSGGVFENYYYYYILTHPSTKSRPAVGCQTKL